MHKFIPRASVLILALFIAVGIQISDLAPQTERQLQGLNQLMQLDTTVQVIWDQKVSVPTRLEGKLTAPVQAPAAEIAMHFFNTNQTLFSMTSPDQELEVVKTKTDKHGWKHVRLQQKYKSLPVEGKTYLVHINPEQEVRMVSGYYQPQIQVNTSPAIDSSRAVSNAHSDLNPQQDLSMTPKAKLIIYPYKDQTYLAWKIFLVCEQPLGEFVYYIDAASGDVINKYNNLQHALNRKTYNAGNGTALPGTLSRSEGGNPTGDTTLDAAHDYAGIVYNFYNNQYGRDSYDDAGATIVSTVHYDQNYNNAFWSPARQQMVYGDGDGTLFGPFCEALDVVAHELTHAVTERESDLVYQDQSGALNESLSDIFAALIDSDDWMIGEDCYTPGTAGDALRYMDNPTIGDQPDHMDDYLDTGSDNGGVHTNSGIPNKAAYLMADGGIHHGINVTGMGRNNMGRVFYSANSYYLQSYDGFVQARQATIDAVQNEFPGDTQKENTVKAAWDAVGVAAFSISLSPGVINMARNESSTLTVELDAEGNPLAGAAVTFTSADNSIATVSPSSGITDASGRTNTIISGLSSCGSTEVNATANYGGKTASSKVQVKVPVTSEQGLFIMIIILITVIILENRIRAAKKITKR
jgi:thermolysin